MVQSWLAAARDRGGADMTEVRSWAGLDVRGLGVCLRQLASSLAIRRFVLAVATGYALLSTRLLRMRTIDTKVSARPDRSEIATERSASPPRPTDTA